MADLNHQCNIDWNTLASTTNTDVQFCSGCSRYVHQTHTGSIKLQLHTALGHCVNIREIHYLGPPPQGNEQGTKSKLWVEDEYVVCLQLPKFPSLATLEFIDQYLSDLPGVVELLKQGQTVRLGPWNERISNYAVDKFTSAGLLCKLLPNTTSGQYLKEFKAFMEV